MLGQCLDGCNDAHIVENVSIIPGCSNNGIVSWTIAPEFTDPRPYTFTLERTERAASEDKEWEQVAGPVVDVLSINYTSNVRTTHDSLEQYRIKLVTTKGTYYSVPSGSYGALKKKEFLLAKSIVRKELLIAKNFNGNTAHVYLKKHHGTKCTLCTDAISGAVLNDNCPSCMGTGWVSGFHGPYPTIITATNNDKRKTDVAADGHGTESTTRTFQFRAVACPYLATGDVIHDTMVNRFYTVESVNHAAEIRRIPIVFITRVSELAGTDIRSKLKDR